MIEIQIKNVYSKIQGVLSEEIWQRLDKELSYTVQGSFIALKLASKRILALQLKKRTAKEQAELNRLLARQKWDGKKHLFTRKQVFPTGCLKRVKNFLEKECIDYKLIDLRVKKIQGKSIDIKTELREYQRLAVEQFLKIGRGVLQISTGGGKTLVFTSVIGRLNVPTIVYVHTCDLLHQTKEVISKELGIECGQIGAGIVDIKKINVATIQSVTRALTGTYVKYDNEDEDDLIKIKDTRPIQKIVSEAELIVVDECHRAATFSVQTISKKSKNAYYRLFTSASPWRDDNADLLIEAASGPKIVRVSSSYLIDRGFLVAPKIYVFKIPRAIQNAAYSKIYSQYVVENEYRNNLIIQSAFKLFKNGKKFLILVKHIKHGKILFEELEAKKIKSFFLQGRVDSLERKDVLDLFRKNELDGLVATSLADEGLDIPNLDAVILAGSGMSSVKALQRVGRTLRPYPGKKQAYVIDFLDLTKYLYKHTNRRLKLYRTEPRFEIKVQGRDE